MSYKPVQAMKKTYPRSQFACIREYGLMLCIAVAIVSCNSQTPKNKPLPAAAFAFTLPAGWSAEQINFPISFAPQLPYTGTESIRFTPGWGNPSSEEYWSYSFLWWIEGSPKIDSLALQKNLLDYYNGLITENSMNRNIPPSKQLVSSINVKQIKAAPGDASSFAGNITMMDYMVQQPITLNFLAHVKACNVQAHTALILEVSPKPFPHAVWKELNAVAQGFSCAKK